MINLMKFHTEKDIKISFNNHLFRTEKFQEVISLAHLYDNLNEKTQTDIQKSIENNVTITLESWEMGIWARMKGKEMMEEEVLKGC